MFFTVILLNPGKSILGHRVVSFLNMKRNPAPSCEEDRWMMLAAKDLPEYFSMALISGPHREYGHERCPAGGRWCGHKDGEEAERWLSLC